MNSIFETYTSNLGATGITPSQFAILVLDMMRSNTSGGLQGMLDRFRDAGFDDAVRSWIGNGANFLLAPADVERVLGHARVELIAHKAGVPPKTAAAEIAALLPQLVDKVTPSGYMPDEDALNKNFDLLRDKIGML